VIRVWRAACIASFALPLAAGAQHPSDFEPTLLQTDSIRIAAQLTNDLATLDRLLGDDLSFGHTDARVDGKKAYMDDLRTGAHKYKSLTTEGVTARDYGSAGVVTGTANVSTEYHGVTESYSMRYTAMYARRKERWVLVAYQSVRIP
jgi:hypothetical protein